MKKDITFFSALAEYRNSRREKKNFSDSLGQLDQETRSNLLNCRISPNGELVLPSNLLFPEKRAVLAEPFAGTDVVGFEPSLQAKSVLLSLGAKLLTGLTANIMVPRASGISSSWEGEIDENIDGTPTLVSALPKPIRISTSLAISNTVLTQTRIDHALENAMQEDVIRDMMSKVELAAINGSGGSGQPLGILNTEGLGSVSGGANGALPTEDHLIDLEKAVADEHADQGYLAFLTNPKVRRQLRKTPLDAGAGLRVWDLNSNHSTSGSIGNLMGYPAGVTANVPSDLTKGEGSSLSAIIFGDFSKLWLCQWGGFSVLLNPYTQSHYNYSIFTIDSWWNVVVKNPKSFAALVDVITEA